MYRVGEKEVQAVRRALTSGKIFRYGLGGECSRFEKRFAKYLGVKHVHMTASGTNSLTAALVGLGIGPGDEVVVPACTFMATPVSVVAAGAIPIIVDIDDSITLDPKALEKSIGPRTKAVIPVHMWGLACNMRAIMRVARKHKLLVLEDACQGVGGAYKGRMLGSIGHAGAFSFNYYKNMTSGEGGAFVTNDDRVIRRGSCTVLLGRPRPRPGAFHEQRGPGLGDRGSHHERPVGPSARHDPQNAQPKEAHPPGDGRHLPHLRPGQQPGR